MVYRTITGESEVKLYAMFVQFRRKQNISQTVAQERSPKITVFVYDREID